MVFVSDVAAHMLISHLFFLFSPWQVVMHAGTRVQAEHARKIAPLRAEGNLLLCTLLLGNVAVNAGLSIVLADLTDGEACL